MNKLFNDYDAFVNKFENKKTTDDCYTPEPVYAATLEWVSEQVDIAGCNVVRPFYPGGDYENYDYHADDVVIDNPPFSIISKIVRFYETKNIRYFLFAPHLTLFGIPASTYIITDCDIKYENGAIVNTDFVSNLFDDIGIIIDPTIRTRIVEAQKDNKACKEKPKYKYPRNIILSTMPICTCGDKFTIPRKKMHRISALWEQKKYKKCIYGSGFIIDDNTALLFEARQEQARQERARQEQARQEQARQEQARQEWKLSEQERLVIQELNER